MLTSFVPITFLGNWNLVNNETINHLINNANLDPNHLNWSDSDYLIGPFIGVLGLTHKMIILVGSIIVYCGLILENLIKKCAKKWFLKINYYKKIKNN
ncbi:hypothetical protein [[Mycoplasma] cavipharyngis]|uniref:hypothetical protein n=1 Tax=[Mycoplasma] cavipharyngis TaxID=92757 RepID=UPI0037040DDB